MNDLYYSLIGSTCFELSPVHHQDHHLIKCIMHWYVCAVIEYQGLHACICMLVCLNKLVIFRMSGL